MLSRIMRPLQWLPIACLACGVSLPPQSPPKFSLLSELASQPRWAELASQVRLQSLPEIDPSWKVRPELLAAWDWLSQPARDNRVVFLGENHNFHSLHQLRDQLLFVLNQFDHYGLISLEYPFSTTVLFDHYLSLQDEEEAEQFVQQSLQPTVVFAETLSLLNSVRAWNRVHSDRPIRVVAHDVEQRPALVVQHILGPFFKSNGVALPASLRNERLSWTELQPQMRWLQDQLDKITSKQSQGGQGDHKFLKAAFIASALKNLNSGVERKLAATGDERNAIRQRAICRNLTDPAFLGTALTEYKALIWVGAFHSAAHYPLGSDERFKREAVYLQHEFEATRGKVYAILSHAGSHQFQEADLQLTPEALKQAGSGTRTLVNALQEEHNGGRLSWGVPYVSEWSTGHSLAWAVIAKTADPTRPTRPVRVNQFPWQQLERHVEQHDPEELKQVQSTRLRYESHDAVLYVATSRPLRLIQ